MAARGSCSHGCRSSPSCVTVTRVVHQGITVDIVNGVKKNVLSLTAFNKDSETPCVGLQCHKVVTSNGAITTAGLFASGRYEVVAKVANASGLVWCVSGMWWQGLHR